MKYSIYRQILNADRNRYSINSHLKLYFLNVGYKITVHYRRCKFLSENKWLRVLYYFERFIYRSMCVKYGCDLPSHITIGPGLKIDHPVGIVVNSEAIIGSNFTIKSGAIIGKKKEGGVAIIGDNVQVGVHALILGEIKIGNNAEIGAGAIVTHDVPNNAIVINQGASIYKIKDSQEYDI